MRRDGVRIATAHRFDGGGSLFQRRPLWATSLAILHFARILSAENYAHTAFARAVDDLAPTGPVTVVVAGRCG